VSFLEGLSRTLKALLQKGRPFICRRLPGQARPNNLFPANSFDGSATVDDGEERGGGCVVAEGLTEVGEAIDIPRAEDEAAAKLKWI
jgi:hypothetical protein